MFSLAVEVISKSPIIVCVCGWQTAVRFLCYLVIFLSLNDAFFIMLDACVLFKLYLMAWSFQQYRSVQFSVCPFSLSLSSSLSMLHLSLLHWKALGSDLVSSYFLYVTHVQTVRKVGRWGLLLNQPSNRHSTHKHTHTYLYIHVHKNRLYQHSSLCLPK